MIKKDREIKQEPADQVFTQSLVPLAPCNGCRVVEGVDLIYVIKYIFAIYIYICIYILYMDVYIL